MLEWSIFTSFTRFNTMKIKLYTTIVAIMCLATNLFGQNIEVSGTVKDAESRSSLFGATIKLIAKQDSALISGTKTDKSGKFKLSSAKSRTALLNISMLGYEDKYIDLSDAKYKANDIALSDILLKIQEIETGVVEVSAAKDIITTEVDKMVINVDKMITSAGGSAVDVLKNVPSVKVDIENNVSLRGNSNIKVLVDGKPSGIPAADLLEQTASDLIEKIEIITNPSAKFNPEGDAGIINIIMKKKKAEGIAGMANINFGNSGRTNGMFNLNYRGMGYNIFAGYSARVFKMNGDNSTKRTYLDPNYNVPIHWQQGTFDREFIGHSINFGSDIYFNEANTLTIMGSYNIGKRERNNNTLYKYYDKSENLMDIFSRLNTSASPRNNLDFQVNYTNTIEANKSELTVEAYYSPAKYDPYDEYTEQKYELSGSPTAQYTKYRTEEDYSTDYLSLKSDYYYQFSKDTKIELGVSSFLRSNRIDYSYKNFNYTDNNWTKDATRSNDFDYDESVSALYSTYLDAWGDFSFQLGLRAEYTHTNGNQKTLKIENKQDYFSIFPSVHLKYAYTEFISSGLSYSKRISRPWHNSVNPFIEYDDPVEWETGNPALKPSYTHNMQFTNNLVTDKTMLNASIYYNYTSDGITYLSKLLENGITLQRPENVANSQDYGLELYGSYQLFKWWRLDGSFNYFENVYGKETANQFDLSEKTHGWSASLNSDFRFWDMISYQVNAYYSGPSHWGQYESKEQFSVYMGLRSEFELFGNEAAISFSVSDVFKTLDYGGTTRTKQYIFENNNNRMSQQIFLGFTYKFNGYKRTKLDSKGGSGAEGVN